MKILKEVKHKNGDVTFECDCSIEEINLLAGVGLNTILKEYIEKLEKDKKTK